MTEEQIKIETLLLWCSEFENRKAFFFVFLLMVNSIALYSYTQDEKGFVSTDGPFWIMLFNIGMFLLILGVEMLKLLG